MSTETAQEIAVRIKMADRMTEADLLDLRRAFGRDMHIDAREADLLFSLNAVSDTPDDWADVFVLLLTTFLVHQGQPEGYISDATAAWLIARIDHDGVVETETELRLLMNVLKTAEVPGARLEGYALKQVQEAVITGRGRIGQEMLTPGIIGKAEVALLRRIFYSVGSHGGVGITRMEAQAIFALNKAVKGRDNAPEWKDFFVGAIANHLMMTAAPQVPSLEEAQRREAWLNGDEGLSFSLSDFSARAILGAFKEVLGFQKSDPTGGFSNLDAEATRASVRLDRGEADWLVEALMDDGEIDENERALLDFIRAECPDIDAHVKPLLDAA